MSTQRTAVASLTMSAAALVAWVTFEGWAPVAVPPIKGDVPTYGFGMTYHEDGSPVKEGEKIEPAKAVRQVWKASGQYEAALRKCFGDVTLYQHEWDAFVLLSKNVGSGAVCKSSIPRKLAAGDYVEACGTILDFAGITRTINGQRVRLSCEVRANGCYGVWRARQAEFKMCDEGVYP